jgi:hypothetical protein
MLFKNTEEIKKYLPVTKSFEWSDIEPFIRNAETDYIIPFLSKAEYDALNAAYNNTAPMANAQKELLQIVRRPLACAAYYCYIPFGNVSIGKAGITAPGNKDENVAAQWRIEDLKSSCDDGYFSGIEQMLLYLESNAGTFTSWNSSAARTNFRDCFINTVDEFNHEYMIGSRRTLLMLKPIISRVERDYILSITGEELFHELKCQVKAGTLTTTNKKLLEFIRPCIASYTIAKATLELNVRITGNGFLILNTSPFQSVKQEVTPKDTPLQYLREMKYADGASSQKQLYNYLYRNHSQYPLFEADTTAYQPAADIKVNTDPDSSLFGLI